MKAKELLKVANFKRFIFYGAKTFNKDIEYDDLDTPEAMVGCHFDDMNYLRYRERWNVYFMEGLKMTNFENRTFRELVSMKSRELERTEREEAIELADELRKLVNRIYAFQQTSEVNSK